MSKHEKAEQARKDVIESIKGKAKALRSPARRASAARWNVLSVVTSLDQTGFPSFQARLSSPAVRTGPFFPDSASRLTNLS